VVADSRSPRDGAFIAAIGHYNPLTDPETIVIDQEKAQAWLKQGAQPTETAARLLAKAGIIEEPQSRKEKMQTGAPKTGKKKKAKAAAAQGPEAGLATKTEASAMEKPKASKEEPETGTTEAATSEEPAEPTAKTSEELS